MIGGAMARVIEYGETAVGAMHDDIRRRFEDEDRRRSEELNRLIKLKRREKERYRMSEQKQEPRACTKCHRVIYSNNPDAICTYCKRATAPALPPPEHLPFEYLRACHTYFRQKLKEAKNDLDD